MKISKSCKNLQLKLSNLIKGSDWQNSLVFILCIPLADGETVTLINVI